MNPQSSDIEKYRQWLVEADYKAIEAYDKAVMWLAGGALGITLAFVKDIVPSPQPDTLWLLIIGWSFFAATLVISMVSLLLSHHAHRRAIAQVDKRTIHLEQPGGFLTTLTSWLNWLVALTLIIGISFVIWYAKSNLCGGG